MYPRLFEIPAIFGIGPLTIYTYGVMLAAAYLAGLQLAIVRGRKAGLDSGRLRDEGPAYQALNEDLLIGVFGVVAVGVRDAR